MEKTSTFRVITQWVSYKTAFKTEATNLWQQTKTSLVKIQITRLLICLKYMYVQTCKHAQE